ELADRQRAHLADGVAEHLDGQRLRPQPLPVAARARLRDHEAAEIFLFAGIFRLLLVARLTGGVLVEAPLEPRDDAHVFDALLPAALDAAAVQQGLAVRLGQELPG